MASESPKVTELVGALPADERFFCCEFFPPKTPQGVENLVDRCRRLTALGALFVSITWGTGGSNAERTLDLASRFQQEVKVPTVLHLTCTNMDHKVLDSALARAKAIGIRNILALRGDPPRDDYAQHSDLVCAADLVKYIRKEYGDYFCIGVAGYPEGHAEGPASSQSVEHDLPYLEEKVRAGADFIVTQLIYDASKLISYEKLLRNHPSGLFKTMPILPGIMPINSYQQFLRSAKLSHASIPPRVLEDFAALDTKDDRQVKAYGVKLLSNMIHQLEDAGINGFHFYTLNLENSVVQIASQCGLIHRKRYDSSSAPSAAAAKPDVDSPVGSPYNSRAASPSVRETKATWDDYTNGRYSDPASAAFGEIDGYGPVIHGAENGVPNPEWITPEKPEDIGSLFVGHITNEIPVIPFSDQPLSAETALIQEELIELNRKGRWTLSSQPGIDKTSSTDRIFGWGPPNGVVHQKAFVEFLTTASDWAAIRQRLDKLPAGTATYFAASEKGAVQTSDATPKTHAVTWGEWDGRTVQSTFVTAESFAAWRDEAFDVLHQWQRLYPVGSAAYKLLEAEAADRVLVTVIYHDCGDELWRQLEQ